MCGKVGFSESAEMSSAENECGIVGCGKVECGKKSAEKSGAQTSLHAQMFNFRNGILDFVNVIHYSLWGKMPKSK